MEVKECCEQGRVGQVVEDLNGPYVLYNTVYRLRCTGYSTVRACRGVGVYSQQSDYNATCVSCDLESAVLGYQLYTYCIVL